MKTRPAWVLLLANAVILAACSPSSNLPATGEVKLAFVRGDATDIHFTLKNGTSDGVSFWGARDWWWDGVFPQGPQFECVLGDGQLQENPYPVIDGPVWKVFVVGSGEAIDIVVSNYYLRDREGSLPASRCRFLLRLEGGAVIKSDEFESRASAL